jgi:hypothetical protein
MWRDHDGRVHSLWRIDLLIRSAPLDRGAGNRCWWPKPSRREWLAWLRRPAGPTWRPKPREREWLAHQWASKRLEFLPSIHHEPVLAIG